MTNVTEHLQIIHNYSVVNMDRSNNVLENGNYIIEKSVSQDSESCAENNSSEKEHSESENVYILENECNSENNIINDTSEMNEGTNLLEKRIIQVISAGNVENIFCIDNIKQEYTVTISNGFQEGSVELSNGQYIQQPLEYQDLNLIYTENCILHMCDVCGKSFRKKSNLKRHYRSHTGDNPHACDQCDARFPTMSRLKEHLHAHTGLRPHTCNICGKSFSRISNLTRHYRTHSAEKPYQCDKCEGRFVEPTRLREHYLTHVGEKRFSCEVCGKCFLKKYNLKRHCRTHTGDHPHVCQTCGRGFSKRIYLLVHVETHTKNKKDVEADSAIETVASNCVVESAEDQNIGDVFCADTFHEDLNSSTNDQENKIFSCKLCSRNYIKENSLLNHMKRHMEGALRCKVCNVTFTHSSRLREHLVSHTGEKPFSCFQCKRRFGRNSNLLRHLQTHTGEKRFSCGLCKRRFSSSSRLREHATLHSGEKPHNCNVCGKLFRHKCGLQRHLLLHTGEKPHQCNTCGKRFNRRGRLSIHCERHHSPKFPNRVEPRLMNIIQNLEARLCEPAKADSLSDDLQSGKERKNNRIIMEKRSKTKRLLNKNERNHSVELEEVTVEITTADASIDDCSPNLLQNCDGKSFAKPNTRSCKAKIVQSELKRREINLLKKRSRQDLDDAISHYSKEKVSPRQTLENGISKLDNFSKPSAHVNNIIHESSQCADNIEQVIETSEEIEIDDVSAYQTQVLGNDLNTIVLIKAAL